MFRTFRRHLECLTVVLLCLSALHSQLPGYNPTSEQSANKQHDGRWPNLFLALASSIPAAPLSMPSPSPVHSPSKKSKSHLGDYMAATGPAASSFLAVAMTNAASSDAMGKPFGIAQPPQSSRSSGTSYLSPSPTSSWLTSPSPPARGSASSSAAALSSLAPPPLLSPPLDTTNVSVRSPDAPLLPPSPGRKVLIS
ncbi:hypothetical protein L7F22_051435 [Adiantum nelumboides]|nr:hypothetical protein [Adiantum nelumboides]